MASGENQLQEQLLNPIRERIRETMGNVGQSLDQAMGSLGRTLDRAGETLDKVGLSDARHLMDRRPGTALGAAAVIGALIGLGLASRR